MVRFKNRWLLVEFIPCENQQPFIARLGTGTNFNGKQIWNALKQSVLANFGDAGWGAVGYSLNVKYYSPTTNMCIIRVGREHLQTVWGSVTSLLAIDGQKILPNVVHVAGTIKHIQLAAIAYNRTVIARYKALASSKASGLYDDFLATSSAEIESLQD